MKLAAIPLLLLLVLQGQDPPPPKPPEGAPPLPQVPDVPMTPVQRKDLWQRFTTPSPIAGTYRLVSAVRGGQKANGVLGWMMVGERYLSIHLQDGGERPGQPSIQTSVRRYELRGMQLTTTSLLGARVPSGQAPALEAEGLVEIRTIQRTHTTLRVLQAEGDYLEFARVE